MTQEGCSRGSIPEHPKAATLLRHVLERFEEKLKVTAVPDLNPPALDPYNGRMPWFRSWAHVPWLLKLPSYSVRLIGDYGDWAFVWASIWPKFNQENFGLTFTARHAIPWRQLPYPTGYGEHGP